MGGLVARLKASDNGVVLEVDVLQVPGGRRTLRIDKTAIVVGRSAKCDVIVRDPDVSRRHLRVELIEGELWAEDMGSSNGSLVNGEQLARRSRIPEGALLRVCDHEIRVRIVRSEPVETTPVHQPPPEARPPAASVAEPVTQLPPAPLPPPPRQASPVIAQRPQPAAAPPAPAPLAPAPPAPMQPAPAPVQHAPAPVQPAPAPVQHAPAPVQPAPAPVQPAPPSPVQPLQPAPAQAAVQPAPMPPAPAPIALVASASIPAPAAFHQSGSSPSIAPAALRPTFPASGPRSSRTFQCTDAHWQRFEQLAREQGCAVDDLVNEALAAYGRRRMYADAGSAQAPQTTLQFSDKPPTVWLTATAGRR
jgi:pSer/pThr/pTyr-binding forkhead associated (FHA) protein